MEMDYPERVAVFSVIADPVLESGRLLSSERYNGELEGQEIIGYQHTLVVEDVWPWDKLQPWHHSEAKAWAIMECAQAEAEADGRIVFPLGDGAFRAIRAGVVRFISERKAANARLAAMGTGTEFSFE
jgi:hypothetical protein|tara:strand:- start:40 stop:423 length:384 start_codon:yes stop_codon:yes gene_type:complete